MQYIYAAYGLPGSGKSTYFAGEKWADTSYHSADEIRVRLFGADYVFNNQNEKIVWSKFDQEVRASLSAGNNVIIDNTNLSKVAVRNIEKLAKEFDAEIIWYDTTNVSIAECIRRNRARVKEYPVPDWVILRMAYHSLPEKFDEEIVGICMDFPEVVAEFFKNMRR